MWGKIISHLQMLGSLIRDRINIDIWIYYQHRVFGLPLFLMIPDFVALIEGEFGNGKERRAPAQTPIICRKITDDAFALGERRAIRRVGFAQSDFGIDPLWNRVLDWSIQILNGSNLLWDETVPQLPWS